MTVLFIILLCGINLAPFFINGGAHPETGLPRIDTWHAHGLYAQVMLMIIFSSTFFVRAKPQLQKNIPMGIFNIWLGLWTAFFCYQGLLVGRYDIAHFFPYFNVLCVMLMYKFVVRYLDGMHIEMVLKWMRYAVIASLLLCVLQYFGFGQFFKLYLPNDPFRNNPVVGFLGNGTHLSGFFAMTIPLFLVRGKREDWLALGLMALIFPLLSTSTRDVAISGFAVSYLLVLYIAFRLNKYIFWLVFSLSLLVLVSVILNFEAIRVYCWETWRFRLDTFVSGAGRISMWKPYLQIFRNNAITGYGLGSVNVLSEHIDPRIRHLHFELWQLTFETGLIGLILALNVIISFLKTQVQGKTALTCKAMVIGWLLAGIFNWNAHLWIPTLWAMFTYASFFVLKSEELMYHGYIESQGNKGSRPEHSRSGYDEHKLQEFM